MRTSGSAACRRLNSRVCAPRASVASRRCHACCHAIVASSSCRTKFRANLHFRLNVVTIDLPPLRARREDIPLLFHSFVNQAAVRLNRVPPPVKDPAIRELLAHNWPGNVREQRNEAERYVLGLRTASGAEIADGPMSLTRAVETFE